MSTTTNISGRPPRSMLDLLNGFVQELRNAGLPVSLTENLDAMEAVQHIPIEDRDAFKYALGATLIKNNSHWRAFETVFEVYFSLRGPEYKLADAEETDLDELWREMQDQQQQGDGAGGSGAMDALTPEEIAQMLMQALLNGDQAMMRALAKQAVQRFEYSALIPLLKQWYQRRVLPGRLGFGPLSAADRLRWLRARVPPSPRSDRVAGLPAPRWLAPAGRGGSALEPVSRPPGAAFRCRRPASGWPPT